MARHRRRRIGGGRPRKDGQRTASGRLSRAASAIPIDPGTVELQRHRSGLCNGSTRPELSASLSGILLAHGIIDDRQRSAADRFRQARAAVYGVVMPDREPGGHTPTDAQIKQRERRYLALVSRLTIEQQLQVIDLALDLRSSWVRRAVLGLPAVAGDDAERRDLVTALTALADRD